MEWHFLPQPEIPADLLAWAKNRWLARLLVQRGVTTVQAAQAFTNASDYSPAPSEHLPDITDAIEHLRQAIAAQTTICVWGDFDVDGQTSTTLLVSVLQALGARVQYYIPNRLTEGHGLKLDRLRQLLQQGVGLILTCDTGIDAHEAVELVHAAGAKIIITDHHDLGDTLPPAEAVINPKRLAADHPLYTLPGVGVAFKLAEGLAAAYGRPELAEAQLDLVALGIVADVAAQTGDTRYLLQRGLEQLRNTERLGLKMLIDIAQLDQAQLTAEHIGFWLGPRLNALGRLGDANLAVELLLTEDEDQARILAAQLDALNERRKLLVDRTVVQALSQLADTPSLGEYNAIVLAAAEWHPGVIGIAASRLVEQFARPVILLAVREGLARGSARSVAQCDIHQAIRTQADLLESFGGHPLAAGLSLRPHLLSDFRRGLSEALQDCVAQIEKSLTIDMTVTLPDLNMDLLDTLQKLAPFGEGNPAVKFAVKDLSLGDERLFGASRAHRRVEVVDEQGQAAEVIWWNGAGQPLPESPFDLALTLSRDTYKQADNVRLVWVDSQQQAVQAMPVPVQRRLIDLRQTADPMAQLPQLDTVFWTVDNVPEVRRFSGKRDEAIWAKHLVFWQAPPGQDTLQTAINTTQPEIIYLVAHPVPFDSYAAFIQRLMGLIKYSLTQYGGRLEIAKLAEAMGHRSATVRLGLQWLVSQRKLRVILPQYGRNPIQSAAVVVVRPDTGSPLTNADRLQEALLDLLKETAAYRDFVRRANPAALDLGLSIEDEAT